jgi:hypothetical protein
MNNPKINANDKYILSKNDELELTDQLIFQLVQENKWGSIESLKKLAIMGFKWNSKLNSCVLTELL